MCAGLCTVSAGAPLERTEKNLERRVQASAQSQNSVTRATETFAGMGLQYSNVRRSHSNTARPALNANFDSDRTHTGLFFEILILWNLAFWSFMVRPSDSPENLTTPGGREVRFSGL